jgi:hypothetical protein
MSTIVDIPHSLQRRLQGVPYLQSAQVRPVFTSIFRGTLKPTGTAYIASATIWLVSSTGPSGTRSSTLSCTGRSVLTSAGAVS